VIGNVRQATREEARAAVQAASEAFRVGAQRRRRRAKDRSESARLMEEAKEELSTILTREEARRFLNHAVSCSDQLMSLSFAPASLAA